MRYLLFSLVVLVFCSCKEKVKEKTNVNQLKVGFYRAILEVQDNEVLPFNFEVESTTQLKIFNAEEVIDVDEITYKNDSIFIKLPVFEGYIAATFKDNKLYGSFIKESLD